MGKPDFKITNTKKKNSDEQQLVFEGDLSIFNADKIQKKLHRMKIDASEVKLVLRNVDSMDLTIIQVLLSIKKSQEKDSKKAYINVDLPADKVELLTKTGFEFILNK